MKEHDFGYCYAIEFNNGTVKIGKSVNIIKRLSEHRSSARKFCVDIVDIRMQTFTITGVVHDSTFNRGTVLFCVQINHIINQ